jgi:hypothetical protein
MQADQPPLSKHGSRMPVPVNAGTNAKPAKPQATNSRSSKGESVNITGASCA